MSRSSNRELRPQTTSRRRRVGAQPIPSTEKRMNKLSKKYKTKTNETLRYDTDKKKTGRAVRRIIKKKFFGGGLHR